MPTISDDNLKKLLAQENCSNDFIEDALPYKSYFNGNIETFIDKVEELLYAIENSDEDEDFNDEDFDEEENYDEDLFDEYFNEDESEEEEEDDDKEDKYK